MIANGIQTDRNSRKPFGRAPVFLLLVILLLSLSIKIALYLLDPYLTRDGSFYVFTVEEWIRTGIIPSSTTEHSWLPLYPFLMKNLSHLGISVALSGICINIIFGAMIPLVAYGLSYEITGQKTLSLCVCLLTAVHPALNSLSIKVQRDAGYLFFPGCLMWSLAAGINRRKWYWFSAAGLFAACSILMRFETAEFLVLVFPVFFFIMARCFSLRKSVHFCLSFFLSFFLFLIVFAEGMGTREFLQDQYAYFLHKKMKDVMDQGTLPKE